MVIRLGKIRLENGRLAEGFDGGVGAAQVIENHAEVVMTIGGVGIESGGFLEEIEGGLPAAELKVDHAEEFQDVGVIGRGGEYAAVELLRLLQFTRLMKVQGGIE